MLIVVTLVLLRMQWAACSHLTLAMRWCRYWPLITCDRVTNIISPTYWPQVAAQMMLHFQQKWSPQSFFLQKTLNVLCIAWHNITPVSSSLSVLLASGNCQNNSTFSYFRSNYLGFEVVLKLFEGQVASLK